MEYGFHSSPESREKSIDFKCKSNQIFGDVKLITMYLTAWDVSIFCNFSWEFITLRKTIRKYFIYISRPRRWQSGLEYWPRKRKVGCSNPSCDRPKSLTAQWPRVPSIGQTLQPFTGNGDVSIWVKNSRLGR